jgi:hypothetical protein
MENLKCDKEITAPLVVDVQRFHFRWRQIVGSLEERCRSK